MPDTRYQLRLQGVAGADGTLYVSDSVFVSARPVAPPPTRHCHPAAMWRCCRLGARVT